MMMIMIKIITTTTTTSIVNDDVLLTRSCLSSLPVPANLFTSQHMGL